VRNGLTVCLVGTLLDLLWQGESSYVVEDERAEGGVRFAARAHTPDREEILFVSIPIK